MKSGRGLLGSTLAVVMLMACGTEVDPEELLTQRTVGLAYLEENRLDEAEEAFVRLVNLAPDEPLGHANLGLTYLRQARYADAEASLREAVRLDPVDPEVRLILATILGNAGRPDEQRAELEAILASHPDQVRSLYTLSEWYRDQAPSDADARRSALLGQVVSLAPANLPARLQLIDLLLRDGQTDSAAAHAEEIRRQVPELPVEASQPFADAIASMREGRTEDARLSMRIAHNALRVTQLYSAGILDVVGPGGPAVGFPVLTFSQDVTVRSADVDAVFAAMRFADATSPAGLAGFPAGTDISVGDFDADGDTDLLLASADGVRLVRNDFGQFADASDLLGAPGRPVVVARFVDVDNNGWLDVLAGGPAGIRMHRGTGGSSFAAEDRPFGRAPVSGGTVIDFDQDGDLDIIAAATEATVAWRNNLDGTFEDRTAEMGLADGGTIDLRLGDFDDDGDVDLVGSDGRDIVWFDNRREGRFVPTVLAVAPSPVWDVAVGDYTNDGWLDLFVVLDGAGMLLRSGRDGTFTREADASLDQALATLDGRRAEFGDVDNDGRLDLVVVGEPRSGSGFRVLRNTGAGFVARDDPAQVPGPLHDLALFDYNEDGDLDVVAVGPAGVVLMRNDGGNANHYLNIALVGLRAGSGKNNHFGIGAKVEVRAGDLYQTRIVTSEVTHFGLGERLKADALRIQWTNGVPQNLFYPGSDQDVVEAQTLKGSCAFLYTWDGESFTFVTDVVWRSALGMPMGIMGGGSGYASAYPSQEYVRIPGDQLKPRDGAYQIQVTEELWESAYLDELRLIAIDHPDSVDVFVDERFRPPAPGRTLDLFLAGTRWPVVRAVDDRGNDVTRRLAAHDYSYVDNLIPGPYQGIMAHHDLILDLGEPAQGRNDLVLYLRGWIFPSDASINVSVAQSSIVESLAPVLQVLSETGQWVTVDAGLSFPSGKDKTIVADLRGRFPGARRLVRIRTNLEIYWDHAFYTQGRATSPVRRYPLSMREADIHHRGFSRMFRRGGRYGPHWFDYTSVSDDDPWGPVIEGNYTRFGDVTELLAAPDDRYVIMAPGDEMTVTFDADLPVPPPGWSRDFLLYTDGWIKDADMNTATGNTVGPLPFRAAAEYPYRGDLYPADSITRRYVESYNTRRVSRR